MILPIINWDSAVLRGACRGHLHTDREEEEHTPTYGCPHKRMHVFFVVVFFVCAHTLSPQQQHVFLTHSIVREISIAPTVSFQWIFSEKDTHGAETTCCGRKIGKEKERAGRRDRLNRCKYCTQRGQTEKPVSSTWRRLCESRNI